MLSKRFWLKNADKRVIIVNNKTGKSNGDPLKVSFPSIIVFKTKKIKNSPVAPTRAICLGRTKESVVVVKKRRGKIMRKIPRIKRLMFSKYAVNSLDLFILAVLITLSIVP